MTSALPPAADDFADAKSLETPLLLCSDEGRELIQTTRSLNRLRSSKLAESPAHSRQ
jgi:hypothetical protein